MKRPNILLILTDQQRADCLGFAGQAQLRTPHLDALAADSVHYANAFCTFPVCTPSRYSLLSGLPARSHGGWDNHCTLAPHLPTFPKSLRAAGYRTTAVGKMHFAPTYLDVGFDQMELCEQDGDGRWDDDYHRDLRENGRLDCLDILDQRAEFRVQAPREYWETCGAMPSDLPEEFHSTTWIANRALNKIESWDETGGNLLMCGFVKPHHPFDPPAPWDAMYNPDEIALLPGWTEILSEFDARFAGYFPNAELTPEKMRRVTAYYYATISQIDFHIGRMIETLRNKGIYDDTIIVFASDHGEYLGFHHLLLKSGPMYDPLMRVPLLIKFAANARGGTRDETLVSLADVAPTLLRAAAIEPPPTMKGRDLNLASANPEFVFTESKAGKIVMARSQRYKLLWSPDANLRQFSIWKTIRSKWKIAWKTRICREKLDIVARLWRIGRCLRRCRQRVCNRMRPQRSAPSKCKSGWAIEKRNALTAKTNLRSISVWIRKIFAAKCLKTCRSGYNNCALVFCGLKLVFSA